MEITSSIFVEHIIGKGPGKRGHIVAHDVSWAAQTGKHLLRTQNVSEKNQKHFLCPGHKICVRNKCCPCGQTGKQMCRQQCVRLVCQDLMEQFEETQHPSFCILFAQIYHKLCLYSKSI